MASGSSSPRLPPASLAPLQLVARHVLSAGLEVGADQGAVGNHIAWSLGWARSAQEQPVDRVVRLFDVRVGQRAQEVVEGRLVARGTWMPTRMRP
jgi:hypothetical protein